jgi:hypothetical protein
MIKFLVKIIIYNNTIIIILMLKKPYNRCISSMLKQWLLPKPIDTLIGTQFYDGPNLVVYSDSRI